MPRTSRSEKVQDSEIADARLEGLPPDPAPRRGRGRPAGSTTRTATRARKPAASRSTTDLRRQVHIELQAFASMFAGLWELKDPHCAGALTEKIQTVEGSYARRIDAIVAQTVDILARSDKVLSVLANAGMIGQAMMLGSLVMPVVKQVWTAHGPNGTGHGELEPIYDPRDYPAPPLAH